MLQTKEEAKKAIRDYLVDVANSKRPVEEYTLSKIADVVKADSTQIENAIEELKSEHIIEAHKVQLDVFIPKSKQGSQALTDFAKKGYIGYSPYWPVALSILLFLIGFTIWVSYQSTLPSVNRIEIQESIIGSLVIGIFGGSVIQGIMAKFRRWQLVSEEAYRRISTLLKYSVYVFMPTVIGYLAFCSLISHSFDLAGVLAILAISVTVSFGYYKFAPKAGSNIE